MNIVFRLAKLEDKNQLEQLIKVSVRGLSKGYYSFAQIESAIKYIFGIDTQLIIDGTYYVAEIEGKVVACGGWSKRNTLYGGDQHKEIVDNLLDPSKDSARIRAFFVHEDWARRGIGKKLISLCETAALSHGFTCMELGATLPGVPLYSALGYEPIEEIDEILKDGEVLKLVKMKKYITLI
ncbi:MAG: GNAT family N-acetyltransferase [Bacteroidota bacterium]